MNIAIFESTVTEDALKALEAEAEKYEGLYVDMSDAKQRKFVKDNSSSIKSILKDIDRKRIDIKKQYNASVDSEAAAITARLRSANKHYTLLEDEWKAERKRILDAEKEKQAAIDLANQIESDHELALMMDKAMALEVIERKQQQERHEQELIQKAKEEAEEAILHQQNIEALEAENEKVRRLADTKHKAVINNECLDSLLSNTSLNEQQAKEVIKAIAKNKINHVTINY
ncbi:MAG: hypothetical protein GY777_20905 [Candidatus Brocadiaceae bacterium]|nr:hypothetical protein [Candidatus Brocadiaceae bacterium]